MLRIAYVGVSHWHRHSYMDPIRDATDMRIVGVTDHLPETASEWGSEIDCYSSTRVDQMCEKVRPDFVFAMGRHCDMAATAEYLMRAGIPFAMEKPCGVSTQEVARLAALQSELGAFAAVPFVWRQSKLVEAVRDRIGYENLRYVLFRRMLGPADRYARAGCDWALDPAQAGGGATLNVGSHWIDLFAHFMVDREIEVVSSHMSNDLCGYPVEDYALITLKAGNATCVTDTGYVYPGGQVDLHHSIVGDSGYLLVSGDGVGRLSREGRPDEMLEVPTLPDYRRFVFEVLDQASDGREPIATIRDMLTVMRLSQDAYEVAGWARGSQPA